MGYFLSIFTDRFSGAVVHLTTDNGSPSSFESMSKQVSAATASLKTHIHQKDEMPASVI